MSNNQNDNRNQANHRGSKNSTVLSIANSLLNMFNSHDDILDFIGSPLVLTDDEVPNDFSIPPSIEPSNKINSCIDESKNRPEENDSNNSLVPDINSIEIIASDNQESTIAVNNDKEIQNIGNDDIQINKSKNNNEQEKEVVLEDSYSTFEQNTFDSNDLAELEELFFDANETNDGHDQNSTTQQHYIASVVRNDSFIDTIIDELEENEPLLESHQEQTSIPQKREHHLSEDITLTNNKKTKLYHNNTQQSDTTESTQKEIVTITDGDYSDSISMTDIDKILFDQDNIHTTNKNKTRLNRQVRLSPRKSLNDIRGKEGNIWFYWYDQYSENKDGSIYLFGKVYDRIIKKHVSCSLLIQNLQREVYILPREYELDDNYEATDKIVTFKDVQDEIKSILVAKQVTDYKMDVCTLQYVLDSPNIPKKASYIKLNYSFNAYELPSETEGKTFSRIFGTETTALDQFIIQNKIKGPCWLEIQNCELNKSCKIFCDTNLSVILAENVSTISKITDLTMSCPPLNIVSLSFQTTTNRLTNKTEFLAISIYFCENVDIDNSNGDTNTHGAKYSILRPFKDNVWPEDIWTHQEKEKSKGHKIYFADVENDLLGIFAAIIGRLDPDIVVCHNFIGGHLDILLRRMKELKVNLWQKIGRLGDMTFPKLRAASKGSGIATYQERLRMSGRLVCDTFTSSRDLVKSKSYHLSELVSSQLNMSRQDIKQNDLQSYYSSSSGIINLSKHCLFDAFLSYALMEKLQILPLTKQLTNLAGNLWSRSIDGNRLERNEYLLRHTFYEKNYLCPDKPKTIKKRGVQFDIEDDIELDFVAVKKQKSNSSGETTSYQGGLVLEPKVGLYDKYVLLLDFNSLYPSIIQEFNVCFTTMSLANDENQIDFIPDTPDESIPTGILPQLVRIFVQRRQKIKQLMRDPNLQLSVRKLYDIEQMALKLTANSMYGCLGSTISRFYAKPLASFITAKGREILKATVELAKESGLNVIYGDTDSIMIYTNENKLQKAREIGEKLKEQINKNYNLLEIDIDKCFKYTLLLAKKKYAAVSVEKGSHEGTLKGTLEVKGLDLVRRDWCELSHEVSENVLKFILSDQDYKDIKSNILDYLTNTAEQIRNFEIELEKFVIQKQLNKSIEEYSNSKNYPHVAVAKMMRKTGIIVNVGDIIPYIMCKNTTSEEEPRMPDDVRNGLTNIDIEWYLSKQILPPVNRLCKPLENISLDDLICSLDLNKRKLIERIDVEEEVEDNIELEETQHYTPDPINFQCYNCEGINHYEDGFRDTSQFNCKHCGTILTSINLIPQVMVIIRDCIQKYYNESNEINATNLYNQLCYIKNIFTDSHEIQNQVDKYLKSSKFRFIDLNEIFEY